MKELLSLKKLIVRMHRLLKRHKFASSDLSEKSRKAIDGLMRERNPKLSVLDPWRLFVKFPKRIREATRLVGKALVQESLENKAFRDKLNEYRYVFVGPEGNLVLTNMNRVPPIGTIRLESNKILLGRYI